MGHCLLAAAILPLLAQAVPAQADHHEAAKAEVIEKDAQGKPTKVRIGDATYDVCTRDDQDSCINPRDAGLDFGNREIGYWPGKPASQIDGPLPLEKPADLPAQSSGEPQES